jgi:hypothetical protein
MFSPNYKTVQEKRKNSDVKAHFRFSFLELSGTSFYKEQFQFSWGVTFSSYRSVQLWLFLVVIDIDYAFMNYFKGKKTDTLRELNIFDEYFGRSTLLERKRF